MPKICELPEAIRIAIVAVHKARKSIRAIVRNRKLSFEGVNKIFKKMELYCEKSFKFETKKIHNSLWRPCY